jgi:MFS family permease
MSATASTKEDAGASPTVRLLATRRFLPYFLTQFLGAFNDNVFKQALIIFIAFEAATGSTRESAQWVTVAAGVFILPFLICSPLAGQLADKFPKSRLIRQIKLSEVIIMLFGALAFWSGDLWFLMGVLFLMGAQSSTFGPLKYGVLPQLVDSAELTAGNALVQAATYVAILAGTLLGGLLMADPELGRIGVSIAVVALATFGLMSSLGIPPVPAATPGLSIDFNPWRQGRQALGFSMHPPAVFAAIVGISWFWFLGATVLQLLPTYGRDVLGGDATVVTLLLVTFSAGVGLGALSCNRLITRYDARVIVSTGALGMALCGIAPWLLTSLGLIDEPDATGRAVSAVLADRQSWSILLSFLGLAGFGGLYVVPLIVVMQVRSHLRQRSRVVAANNIMNALFMVGSAIGTIVLLRLEVSLVGILGLASIFTVVVLAHVWPRLGPAEHE